MAGQLAFDLELDEPEPLYYDHMPDPKKDCCRDCRLPVKGHYSHFQGGVGDLGWFMVCDRCIAAKNEAARLAAPLFDCGIHKQYFETNAHWEECLDCVCPFCGEQEPTAFTLMLNHSTTHPTRRSPLATVSA